MPLKDTRTTDLGSATIGTGSKLCRAPARVVRKKRFDTTVTGGTVKFFKRTSSPSSSIMPYSMASFTPPTHALAKENLCIISSNTSDTETMAMLLDLVLQENETRSDTLSSFTVLTSAMVACRVELLVFTAGLGPSSAPRTCSSAAELYSSTVRHSDFVFVASGVQPTNSPCSSPRTSTGVDELAPSPCDATSERSTARPTPITACSRAVNSIH
mmetsp:Transcript_12199/g.37202  ORF Transcript_12199/g.37202 Transcript_12199/m.37202 type:complete len:214 (+) Transcript_12199:1221-1862(+)